MRGKRRRINRREGIFCVVVGEEGIEQNGMKGFTFRFGYFFESGRVGFALNGNGEKGARSGRIQIRNVITRASRERKQTV